MVDPNQVMLGRNFIVTLAEQVGLDASKIRGIQIEAWADDVMMVKVWYFGEKNLGELNWQSITTVPKDAEQEYLKLRDSADQERRRHRSKVARRLLRRR